MQTIVLHFCYFVLILLFWTAYNTSLIYCFVIWCLHTNKRRPCSSTLSGHPSSSFGLFITAKNFRDLVAEWSKQKNNRGCGKSSAGGSGCTPRLPEAYFFVNRAGISVGQIGSMAVSSEMWFCSWIVPFHLSRSFHHNFAQHHWYRTDDRTVKTLDKRAIVGNTFHKGTSFAVWACVSHMMRLSEKFYGLSPCWKLLSPVDAEGFKVKGQDCPLLRVRCLAYLASLWQGGCFLARIIIAVLRPLNTVERGVRL